MFLIASYFIRGATAELMDMLGFLVIMTHMPLINAKVPGNAYLFFKQIFETAKWDPIPYTDEIFEYFFGYIESEPKSINFEDLGYETSLVTNNLGSLFFLQVYQYFILSVVIVGIIFGDKCSKMN